MLLLLLLLIHHLLHSDLGFLHIHSFLDPILLGFGLLLLQKLLGSGTLDLALLLRGSGLHRCLLLRGTTGLLLALTLQSPLGLSYASLFGLLRSNASLLGGLLLGSGPFGGLSFDFQSFALQHFGLGTDLLLFLFPGLGKSLLLFLKIFLFLHLFQTCLPLGSTNDIVSALLISHVGSRSGPTIDTGR